MSPRIYHYHPHTGEYLAHSLACASPLEPGRYLVPIHATEQPPPPAGPQQVAVFDGQTWTLAADWRAVPLWRLATGEPCQLTQLGASPAEVGATEQAPPSPAHVWRHGQWQLDATQAAALLLQLKTQLANQLDEAADRARQQVAGDPLRVMEYERARAEASAYQAASYRGTVPPAVQAWAEATGCNGQQAAERILTESAKWDAALYGIRAWRLKAKEAIRQAQDATTAQALADSASQHLREAASRQHWAV
ncbi:phage tail protein [Chitinivorax sp. B]|uniref:phage tail protein n=1 Tax=Chitinivorax sp. B TaxID=2502235 RepID=UPI0010F93C6C|nr:phage tail protein [Chitinivorax sp. B]